MDFNKREDLQEAGFAGFKSVYELWDDRSHIPRQRGVYMVLRLIAGEPKFMNPGVGGFFKDQDPNMPTAVVKSNYISGSRVIYIGKAGSPTGKATLHSRLSQYLRFGQGKNVGHWGGRFIWQLKDHSDLVICWKSTPDSDPREIEKSLIRQFILQFGRKPFANLVK